MKLHLLYLFSLVGLDLSCRLAGYKRLVFSRGY